MTKPPALGSVNGFIATPFEYKGERHIYNGTPRGLACKAYELGVRPGDEVTVFIWREGEQYVMTPQGGGDRTPEGVWMKRASLSVAGQ